MSRERVNFEIVTRPDGGYRVTLDLTIAELESLPRESRDSLSEGLATIARAINGAAPPGSQAGA